MSDSDESKHARLLIPRKGERAKMKRLGLLVGEPPPYQKKPPRVRITFHVPPEIAEEVRDAVVYSTCQTMDGFGETALRLLLTVVRSAHNAGKPFPVRESNPKKGRPRLRADDRNLGSREPSKLARPVTQSAEASLCPRPGSSILRSASDSNASNPVLQTDNYPDLADKLVQAWFLHANLPEQERDGLIRAAQEASQWVVETRYLTPIEAYTALQTYQEIYFESPLFKSGKGYPPLTWFRNARYL